MTAETNKAVENIDRILFLGDRLEGVRTAGFFDRYNLSEFDTIVLRPSGLKNELPREVTNQSSLEYTIFQQLIFLLNQRIDELKRWVGNGGTLIIIVEHPLSFFTSKMSREEFHFDRTSIYLQAKFRYSQGRLIEFCGPPELQPQLAPWLLSIAYDVIFESSVITPLLRVSKSLSGNNEILGGWSNLEKGKIIYAPGVQLSDIGRLNYYKTWIILSSELNITRSPLPEWSEKFIFEREAELLTQRSEIDATIASLYEKSEILGHDIEKSRAMKALFAATGDDFVDAVMIALTNLGLKVTKGPPRRADLIATDGIRLLAIEAKGLEGGSKERDLRQTDRWKAEVDATITSSPDDIANDDDLRQYAVALTEIGVTLQRETVSEPCKGIMIIGTYRKMPLNDRQEPDFPSPLISRIRASEVCAISGLGLLTLTLQAGENPLEKSKVINLLFSTSGELIAPQWQTFLMQQS